MYFWKVNKLANAISTNRLGEKDKMFYLLLGQLIVIVLYYFPLFPISDEGVLYYFEWAIVSSITVAGIIKCYKVNGAKSGDRLLEYFVCLSVPLTIKLIVIFGCIFYLVVFITDPFVLDVAESYPQLPKLFLEYFTFLIIVSMEVVFFVRIVFYIKLIKTNIDTIKKGSD